jgi:hypothetical protein
MNKYLDLLVAPATCDISDASDQSCKDVPPPSPFGRLGRFGRTFLALQKLCPDRVPVDRWQQCIADAETFLQQWGERAFELGWTVSDLFGLSDVPINPAPLYNRMGRYDEIGLLWLLDGRKTVVELTAGTAAIQNRSGSITTYRRHNKPALGGRSGGLAERLGPKRP